jgi:hypothetical protein
MGCRNLRHAYLLEVVLMHIMVSKSYGGRHTQTPHKLRLKLSSTIYFVGVIMLQHKPKRKPKPKPKHINVG